MTRAPSVLCGVLCAALLGTAWTVAARMTDQKGAEIVPFYFGPTPRLGVLFFVTTHTYERYGNLVTYMRLNTIVPPSSETPPPAPPR
jgi:hypothetical protein